MAGDNIFDRKKVHSRNANVVCIWVRELHFTFLLEILLVGGKNFQPKKSSPTGNGKLCRLLPTTLAAATKTIIDMQNCGVARCFMTALMSAKLAADEVIDHWDARVYQPVVW